MMVLARARSAHTIAAPAGGAVVQGRGANPPAPEGIWLFREECPGRTPEDGEPVKIVDRKEAIAWLCKRECGGYPESSRIREECLGVCTTAWITGRTSGGVWGIPSCRYTVTLAPPPPQPTPESLRSDARVQTSDERKAYWKCKRRQGISCDRELETLRAACARQAPSGYIGDWLAIAGWAQRAVDARLAAHVGHGAAPCDAP